MLNIMKKKIIIVLAVVVIISIFFIVSKESKIGSKEEISSLPINYIENGENTIQEENISQDNEEEQEKIEQMAEIQGLQGNTSIYELTTEYDGRETLSIKPWIKFQIALIGAIKKAKPEYEEMNDLLKQAPEHTGVWITETSREKFLNLLNEFTKATYTIDNNGYLNQEEKKFMNQYDKKIKQMLSSNNLYVFDISSISYLVDEVTGEIRRISI